MSAARSTLRIIQIPNLMTMSMMVMMVWLLRLQAETV